MVSDVLQKIDTDIKQVISGKWATWSTGDRLLVTWPNKGCKGFHYDIEIDNGRRRQCGVVIGRRGGRRDGYALVCRVIVRGMFDNLNITTSPNDSGSYLISRNHREWIDVRCIEHGGWRLFRYPKVWLLTCGDISLGTVRRDLIVRSAEVKWTLPNGCTTAIALGSSGSFGKRRRELWPWGMPESVETDICVAIAILFRCIELQADMSAE